MKCQKLLAILLSVTLLIGLIPAAGMILPGAAEDPVASTVVSKINLSKFDSSKWHSTSFLTNGSSYGVFCYADAYSILRPTATNNISKLSFDYYLPAEVGVGVYTPHGGEMLVNEKTGSRILEPGVGSFELTREYSSVWRWTLSLAKNPSAPAPASLPDIYIWNVRMEYNGTVVTTPTTDSSRLDNEIALSIKDAKGSVTASDVVETITYGDIAAMVEAAKDDIFVNEIDFTGSVKTDSTVMNNYTVNLYTSWTKQLTAGTYTLTFDYYLPDTGTNTYISLKGTRKNEYPGSEPVVGSWLLQGRHKFKATNIALSAHETTYVSFIQRSNVTFGKLYVWNVKIAREDGGDQTNMLRGGYWGIPTETGKVAKVTSTAQCGHVYADATCTAPKTCWLCGHTDGKANGHTYGDTDPKTCTVCGYIEDVTDIPVTDTIYVDAVNGSDDKRGGSETTAVKTVAKALEIAKTEKMKNPIITVVGKAVYDSAALSAYEDGTVIFVGKDSGAVLTYGGADMSLKSDVCLQNLVLTQDVDNGKIYTNGYDLQFGNGVTFARGTNVTGLDNPVIVTGASEDEYESLVLVGCGSAGVIIGKDGATADATRIVAKGQTVDTVTVDANNAEAEIKMILDDGKVSALNIEDDAVFAALQVLVKNGGSLLGAEANANAWYVDAGDTDATLTNTPGTVHVTAPKDKFAIAVTPNGETIYVAGDKTAIGSDETPVTNYVNTKYTDWGCFDQNGAYLVNTYNKLTQDKKLNVVYFGGSLTAGYGCGVNGDPNGLTKDGITEDAYSWRGRSGKWLKENFPDADITLNNCAIGESGTFLGTYRVQNDIITAQPDLLFIEYAINDKYNAAYGTDKAQAKLQLETIVREVKSALPTCDIVITLTTDVNVLSKTAVGEFFDQAAGHYELAEEYGLPVMNIGLGLSKNIAAIEGKTNWWEDYWTDQKIWSKYFCDIVHPYSTGHEQYFLCVKEFLENNLLYTDYSNMTSTRTALPAVKSQHLLDGNRVNLIGEALKTAVTATNKATFSSGLAPGIGSSQAARAGYYTVNADGNITIKFNGTEILLWNTLASGGTTYTYSIDGGAEKTLTKSGLSPTVFATGLTPGEHTLTVHADKTMYVVGIFSRDETKQTLKGAKHVYLDGARGQALTLPAGSYELQYAATVGDLPTPTLEGGATFLGWAEEGKELLDPTASLTAGMVLKAVDSSDAMMVYVSASGNDTIGDGTSAKPYLTLAKAMLAIDAKKPSTAIINVVGTLTLENDNDATRTDKNMFTGYKSPAGGVAQTPNYTTPVTIQGSAGASSAINFDGNLWLSAPVTFKNITLNMNSKTIYAHKNSVTFASSAVINKASELVGGLYAVSSNYEFATPYVITVNNGTFNKVFLGNNLAHPSVPRSTWNPRVDFVLNGGTVGKLWLGINNNNSNLCNQTHGGNKYLDDVTITVNGGTLTAITANDVIEADACTAAEGKKNHIPTNFNGNAVQIILNDGNTVTTLPTAAEVEAKNGELYVIKCPKGISLTRTEETGSFSGTVSEGMTLVATNADTGEKVYANNGVLSVTPGTWEVGEAYAVYVSASGDDVNGDGSAKAPYLTLAKAMQVIENEKPASAVILVIGTLTVYNDNDATITDKNMFTNYVSSVGGRDQTANYTVPVTIQGAAGKNSAINFNGHLWLSGPITFDNITLNVNSKTIYAHKNSVTFGSNAVINNASNLIGGLDSVMSNYEFTTPYVMTVNNGTFNYVFFGNNLAHPGVPAATVIPRVDFVLNNGTVNKVWLGINSSGTCNQAHGGNTYKGDVTITVNGGTLTSISANDVIEADACTAAANKKNHKPTSFNGHAVQILLNDGNTVTTLPTAAEVEAKNGQLYILKCAEGVFLTRTNEAGTYTVSVPAGKVAVVKKNGILATIAVDGVLSVTPGTYTVEYMDSAPYVIAEDGMSIDVLQTVEVDFSTIPHIEKEGDLFLGWYVGDTAATKTLTAGTVLTAKYLENWNADANDDGKGDNFFMVGSALRDTSRGKTQALRFIMQLNKSVINQLPDAVEYGTILLPNDYLSVSELVMNGLYQYNGKNYNSATVEGKNLYRETSNFVQYTAAIINIKKAKYMTAYAARGYMKYTDANGIEHLVYATETIASSLNEVSEIVIERATANDNVDTAKTIVADAKAEELSKYEKKPLNSSMLLDGVKLHADIDANGKYVASDGMVIDYYKLDDGSRHNNTNVISAPTVREIVIDAVSGDGATPTVITQLSDFHFNYCNEEDFAENNLWTMSSWNNRTMNQNKSGLHYTVSWHRQAMKYAAAVGDQMVLTGDIIDYFSHGNMELIDRYISQPYSNAFIAIGNHEATRVMGLSTDPTEKDPTTRAEYCEMLQKVWSHDIDYTSKVLNNEVMVIQFDNGTAHVSTAQLAKMSADFETARKNGYTVLLFAHDPFRLDNGVTLFSNGSLSNGMSLAEGSANETNRQLYDLFIEYSDVVRGFFTGHEHADIYASITGVKDGKQVSIPQFTLVGNYNCFGNITQITVK